MESELTNFNEVLLSSIEALRPAILAKQVQIRTITEGSLDSIYGNRYQLQQDLRTLLTNTLENTNTKGTIFIEAKRINSSLELLIRNSSESVHVYSPGQGLGTTFSLRGLRILVIDDAPDNVILLKKFLEKSGAIVDGKISPWEGLIAAKENTYDVIISDIGMPGLNGYELITNLREWESTHQRPPTPAIALTAYASFQDSEKSLAAGFQVHLAKPASKAQIENEILGLLRPSISKTRSFIDPNIL